MKDYTELVVTAAASAEDPNLSNFASSLVAMAEAKLSRKLKVRQAIETKTLRTNNAGTVSLPRGFIATVHIFHNNKQLENLPLNAIKGTQNNQAFSLIGDTLHTNLIEESLEITFYSSLPSLEETGCNWLLEEAPDIYLQALLLEAAAKALDVEKAAIIKAYLDNLVIEFVAANRVSSTSEVFYGGFRP